MIQTTLASPAIGIFNQNIIHKTIETDLNVGGQPYGLNRDDMMMSTRIYASQNPTILAVGAYLVKPTQHPKRLIGGIYLFNSQDDRWQFTQKIMFGELSIYNTYFGEQLAFNPEGTLISILPSEQTKFYQSQGYPIINHHVEYEPYENSWRLCRYNCL